MYLSFYKKSLDTITDDENLIFDMLFRLKQIKLTIVIDNADSPELLVTRSAHLHHFTLTTLSFYKLIVYGINHNIYNVKFFRVLVMTFYGFIGFLLFLHTHRLVGQVRISFKHFCNLSTVSTVVSKDILFL